MDRTPKRVFIAGVIACGAGIAAIIFAYAGVARETAQVSLQLPYLASGGLIGLALTFIGGNLLVGAFTLQAMAGRQGIGSPDSRTLDPGAQEWEAGDPPAVVDLDGISGLYEEDEDMPSKTPQAGRSRR